MITGSHAVLFAQDPVAARAFLRDVLELPHVDAGDSWLIFKLPPAEAGVHPTDGSPASGTCMLYLMCDDLDGTVRDLRERGVAFVGGVQQAGFGRLVNLTVPGAGEIGLYEPTHPVAVGL